MQRHPAKPLLGDFTQAAAALAIGTSGAVSPVLTPAAAWLCVNLHLLVNKVKVTPLQRSAQRRRMKWMKLIKRLRCQTKHT